METGKTMQILQGHSGVVNCVRLSLKEDLIFSASDDKLIKIWDAYSSKLIETGHDEGHTGIIFSVCLTHGDGDNQIAATAGVDLVIRLWLFKLLFIN